MYVRYFYLILYASSKHIYLKLFPSFENQSSDQRVIPPRFWAVWDGSPIPQISAEAPRRYPKTSRAEVCTNWYGRARTDAHSSEARQVDDKVNRMDHGARNIYSQPWTRWKPIGLRTEVKFRAWATRRLVKMLLGVLGAERFSNNW